MGVVNVTPDSFADERHSLNPVQAVAAGVAMEADGADILDIGGESTRPGSQPISVKEELARVLPVIDGLIGKVRIPISIDTYKSEVAIAALSEGVSIVNDISGLRHDLALADAVAKSAGVLVLMHNRGDSRDMYREASYRALMEEVSLELVASIDKAVAAGVPKDRIILDPGIGFAKRAKQSGTALAKLDALNVLDRPLLVGPSRKSFLQAALGERLPNQREWGTAAAVTSAVLLGAHIVRVHGVREMVQVVKVADFIRDCRFKC